jgi:thiol-disulfide isomerase/thioredoxin
LDLEGTGKQFISDTYELKLFLPTRNDIIIKEFKINNHLAKEGESMRLSGSQGSTIFFFLIAIILLWCVSSKAQALPNSLVKTSLASDKKTPFPVFELPIPQDDAQKNYLGISGSGKFMLRQIKSPVIIIEVFSTDCPYCQSTAPLVNELYLAIQARPDLKKKIKIIGIVNNGTKEVYLFRARYKVSFPLFPDQDGAISQKLGIKRTPTFFGVKNNDDGTMEKFYFKTGKFWFWNVNRFLKKIIKLSKLE